MLHHPDDSDFSITMDDPHCITISTTFSTSISVFQHFLRYRICTNILESPNTIVQFFVMVKIFSLLVDSTIIEWQHSLDICICSTSDTILLHTTCGYHLPDSVARSWCWIQWHTYPSCYLVLSRVVLLSQGA